MQKILSDNKKTYLFFLILSLLFYGNSIKNGFCFDDSYVTVTNIPVKGKNYVPNHELVSGGFKSIPKIWRSHYGHGNGTSYDYRPVVTTMFAIEYAIFGQAPHINHFVNIVLYALLCFYLFQLLKKCLGEYSYKELFALVCSALFLAHPIHTEVVNNIKCRDELLALIFILLMAIHVLRFYESRKIKYLVFSIIFLFLGLYSKLTSAIIIPLIPLILFFFSKLDRKKIVYAFIGFAGCFYIYMRSKRVFINEKMVRHFFHFENPLYTEHVSFYTRVLFALKTFGTYLKLLFFPYPLRFYYGTSIMTTNVSIVDFEIILALVFLIAASYYCYKSKSKIALFGLLFFLIAIAPLTNLIQPVAGIVGERLCFTASIGFVVFITAVLFSFYKTIPQKITLQLFSKKPLNYLTVVLFLFLFYTWNRNSYWDNELSLFEHDAPFLEKSGGANNLLANKYFEMFSSPNPKYSTQVLVEKCMKHYNLAIAADTSIYSAFNNGGVVEYKYLNQYEIALNYFVRAIRSNPVFPQANENIGDCYDKLNNPEKAIQYYQKAITQNPDQRKSYLQMIKILMNQKKYPAAFKMIELADKYIPNDYQVTIQTGMYYFEIKEFQKAAKKFEQAYASYPTKTLAYSLYTTYNQIQDAERAAYYKTQFEKFVQ